MRMKYVFSSLLALVIVVATIMVVPAYAQEATPMTDAHIARIKSNCPVALATLSRIHANDAPAHINRNQTYFSISDKLMARFNSRLVLNRYDATQLVKTSTDFNTQLAKYKTLYKEYDETMTDLLRINCRLQPVGFYDKVAEAREARQRVHESVVRLKLLIDQYGQDVNSFKSQHFSGGNQ